MIFASTSRPIRICHVIIITSHNHRNPSLISFISSHHQPRRNNVDDTLHHETTVTRPPSSRHHQRLVQPPPWATTVPNHKNLETRSRTQQLVAFISPRDDHGYPPPSTWNNHSTSLRASAKSHPAFATCKPKAETNSPKAEKPRTLNCVTIARIKHPKATFCISENSNLGEKGAFLH